LGASGASRSAALTSPAEKGVPHIPQKRNEIGFEAPQLAQICSILSPHMPQKFIPVGFSKPQFEHWIDISIIIQRGWRDFSRKNLYE
jgi:hypothetical protein